MGTIILILIAALILYVLYKIYMRTVEWVLEPLEEYMKDKEFEKVVVEEKDNDGNAIIIVEDIDKPVHIPKFIVKKSQNKPMKLSKTNLWLYKDYIFPCRPTSEQMFDLFGKQDR